MRPSIRVTPSISSSAWNTAEFIRRSILCQSLGRQAQDEREMGQFLVFDVGASIHYNLQQVVGCMTTDNLLWLTLYVMYSWLSNHLAHNPFAGAVFLFRL